MKAIFYGDDHHARCYPISLSRPAYTLLVGTSRIFEKWVKALGIEECSFISREYLADFLALETGIKVNVVFEEDYFLIDGRFLPDARIVAEVPKLRAGEGISSNGEMVVCRIDGKRASESKKEARGSFIELINTI